MSTDAKYSHDLLDNPASQIRLLQILPADKAAPITISIEAFARLKAPSYSALSYTWGEATLSKRVQANSRVLDITENCWYALGQLRLSGSADHYYWVDQLCIDQVNQDEKSAQVNLMGDIFRNAALVFVSLGRHTKESAFLFSQMTPNGVCCPQTEPGNDIRVDNWLTIMDDITLARLLSAYTAFGRLRYWKRLWTAQEFALPANVTVLCGNGRLPWNKFVSLHAMLCKLLHINREYYRGRVAFNFTEQTLLDLPMRETQTLRSTVRSSLPRLADFSKVILQHGMRDCAEVKDRIFGLLSLVEWPDDEPRLIADYSKSKTNLALRSLSQTSHGPEVLMSYRLLKMLEIASDDVQMAALWSARSVRFSSTFESEIFGDLPLTLMECIGNRSIGSGELSQVSPSWKVIELDKPPGCFSQTYTMIHTCSLARSGDIIVQFRVPSTALGATPKSRRAAVWDEINEVYDRAGLVLRQDTEEQYEIIGHAYFSNDPASPWGTPSVVAEFDLHLGKEDLLFWTWQLCLLKTVATKVTDPEITLERLATRFCGKRWSSYAMKREVSSKALLHDTAVAAAHLTQNGPDVRQALALKKIG